MSRPGPSRSTLFRRRQADRIDSSGVLAMVACTYCVKHGLPCRISSLHQKCGNCVRFGSATCEPESVPLPDYSKIDKEMSRLESLEDEEEAKLRVDEEIAEAALRRARETREKLQRLKRQKKLLRQKEQQMFDMGMSSIEELEQLEALNQEVASVVPDVSSGTAVVDWSSLWSESSHA